MTRRQFAIRLASTKEFVAIVPVIIDAGRSAKQVEAILWDEIDKEADPFQYEYCPVRTISIPEANGRWLVPQGKGVNWEAFDEQTNGYYAILRAMSRQA